MNQQLNCRLIKEAKANVLTIDPADAYNLKECKKHDGHYSSVMVHQLENINSHLNRDT